MSKQISFFVQLVIIISYQSINGQAIQFKYHEVTDYEETTVSIYVYPETWDMVIHRPHKQIDYEAFNYITNEHVLVNSSLQRKKVQIINPDEVVDIERCDTVSIDYDDNQVGTLLANCRRFNPFKSSPDSMLVQKETIIDFKHQIIQELPFFPKPIPYVEARISDEVGIILSQSYDEVEQDYPQFKARTLLAMGASNFSPFQTWQSYERVQQMSDLE